MNQIFVGIRSIEVTDNLLDTINKFTQVGITPYILFNGASKDSLSKLGEFKNYDYYKHKMGRLFPRVKIVEKFINTECTHLLMVDDDDLYDVSRLGHLNEYLTDHPVKFLDNTEFHVPSEVVSEDKFNHVYPNLSVDCLLPKSIINKFSWSFSYSLNCTDEVNYLDDFLFNQFIVYSSSKLQFVKDSLGEYVTDFNCTRSVHNFSIDKLIKEINLVEYFRSFLDKSYFDKCLTFYVNYLTYMGRKQILNSSPNFI